MWFYPIHVFIGTIREGLKKVVFFITYAIKEGAGEGPTLNGKSHEKWPNFLI